MTMVSNPKKVFLNAKKEWGCGCFGMKTAPKTKASVSLSSPILKFTNKVESIKKPESIKNIESGASKDDKLQSLTFTQQKMKEIREKRQRNKEKIEERKRTKLEKYLLTKKKLETKQREIDTASHAKKYDISYKIQPYFLTNREIFTKYIDQKLFTLKESKGDEQEIKSCLELNASKTGNFSLLLHQDIVKEYLNIYSPYRGLFLYFGLGAGKTCASIAIAEGLKDYNKIVIMTPASLEENYKTELKFCGDDIFRKNHHWVFVKNNSANAAQIEELLKIMNIPVNILTRNGGIWATDDSPKNKNNYSTLNSEEQKSLNLQIDALISNKYKFIHYNGLRNIDKYEAEGLKNGGNYFNNKVVIIDEVHNFIGTISNQLGNNNSFNYKLYNYLMDAENCKIVFLTGTPIINYPNEIGIFFNILRGRIKTYEFTLQTTKESKIKRLNLKYLKKILFIKNDEINYIDFNNSNNKLIITRNPFRFITRYKKTKDRKDNTEIINYNVIRKEGSEFDTFRNEGSYEIVFIDKIVKTLEKHGIYVSNASGDRTCEKPSEEITEKNRNYNKVCIKKYNCLPDDYDSFVNKFIDPNTQELVNTHIFKKRIMGLTSYFRAAVDGLLPSFDPEVDINEVLIDMSPYQLSVYNKIRNVEISKEKSAGIKMRTTNDIYKNSSASYKIYSRECCNFAFPETIERPRPRVKIKEDNETEDSSTKKISKIEKTEEVGKPTSNEIRREALTKEALLNAAIIDSDEPVANIESDTLSNKDDVASKDLKDFEDISYEERLKTAITDLETNKNDLFVGENLIKYSPKFKTILDNINNQIVNKDGSTSDGTHLVYSFFNNVEGLGIFKMVMEANGYARFQINQKQIVDENGNKVKVWQIDMDEADLQKPCYVLYSGNEDSDKKEYLRLIFNSEWDKLPDTLRKQLLSIRNRLSMAEDDSKILNNFHGEVIKVFMITAAGAEGITLKNIRAVHLMEPYWHPVRFQQVIGRAVRICSHENLDEMEQSVKVYVYLMKFAEKHIKGDSEAKEEKMKKPLLMQSIIMSDRSKDNKQVITSDQKLYEISNIKKKINLSILKAIKESSIDCKIHKKAGDNLQCFNIKPNINGYLYNPDITKDAPPQIEKSRKKLLKVKIKGKYFYLKKYDENSNKMKGILYDFEAYKKNKQLIKRGETGK